MKGSIRFNNEINVEVAVDPSQDEGAKLLSAVNLVDGQELSPGGGGSNIPTHNIKIEAYDTGADELVNYKILDIAYFYTDRQTGDLYGFPYSFNGMAPEDHILFDGERDNISMGDGENSWMPDPDAILIRSVSGNATKD